MNRPITEPPRTFAQRLRVISLAAIVAAGVAISLTLGGFVFGIVCSWAGFVRGESATWAPLSGAFCGFLAGVAIGLVFSWKFIATRFGVGSNTTWKVGIVLLIIVPAAEYAVLRLPQITGPSNSASRINIEAVANDASLVIVQVSQNDFSLLYKVDTDTGRATRLTKATDFEEGATFSPDDKRMAFVSRRQRDDMSQIVLHNLDGSELSPLLSEAHADFAPHFSQNGKLIYFARPASLERYARGFEMYSAKADGSVPKQLTHKNFGGDDAFFSIYPESVSADGTQVLMKAETGRGNTLLIYSLVDEGRAPSMIVPEIPNGPDSPQIVSAYFSSDAKDILLMAASQGQKYFDYDIYRLEIASRRLERLTKTNGYASDLCISQNGERAAFFTWTLSQLNSVPIHPSLQVLNIKTRAISTVAITGLP